MYRWGVLCHYASAAAEGMMVYEEAAEAHLEYADDAGDMDKGGYCGM